MAERLNGAEKREFERQYRHALRGRIELDGITFPPSDQLIRCVESIIAARVRAARAQELRDAALDISENHYLILPVGAQVGGQVMPDNWLRDRANHIESSQTG